MAGKPLLIKRFMETPSCLLHIIVLVFSNLYSDPYAEVFVGKPFVQTVDLKNLTEVEEALRDIINSEVIIIIIYLFFLHLVLTEGNLLNIKTPMQNFKPEDWKWKLEKKCWNFLSDPT